MTMLPRELWTAAQVRELDRRAIEDRGIPGYTLMQRAASAAFTMLESRWPAARRVTVLCGAGNNAGDGYVIARLARQAGMEVDVAALVSPDRLSGDAAKACADFVADGGRWESWSGGLPGAGPVVDAMLGTGLDRPLEGVFGEAAQAVAESGRPVLAVDIPTGLHADTGRVMGAVVPAQVTATFIGLKLGLFTGRGPAVAGRIGYADLGVPEDLAAGMEPAALRGEPTELGLWLAPRTRDAHKGAFGHVLVVGGEEGMGGAARMAAEAALRAGAGLVSVATRPVHVPAVLAARPEVMCRGLDDPDALAPLLDRATVLALGPGLGRSDWSRALYRKAAAAGLPTVLDADGLNLLAEDADRRDDRVITPHPGEAARLLGIDTTEVQADRPAAARALAQRFGGVAVLKGAGTVVAREEGPLWICDRGNPGMASGGMGDVLTGVIAGLAAQLGDLHTAARLGVLAHALAADDAASAGGERGLAAGDVLDRLRAWVNPGDAHRPA
ncbi:MAG: NAD(P)H-hydrate dehydratase [Gammaproteobacteria bacterium]